MLKGLQYYSDDARKVGETFIRLERDFDHHVDFCRELPNLIKMVGEEPVVAQYLQVRIRRTTGEHEVSSKSKLTGSRTEVTLSYSALGPIISQQYRNRKDKKKEEEEEEEDE